MDRQHFTDFRAQIPLEDFSSERIELTCVKCDRRGRLLKATLIEEFGPTFGLVNLLNALSRDCPEQVPDAQGIRRCGARYLNLTSGSPPA